MAVFEITGTDGKTYRVEGADQQGALGALEQHVGAPQSGSSSTGQQSNVAAARAELQRRQSLQAAQAELARRQGGAVPPPQTSVAPSGEQYTPEQQAFVDSINAQPKPVMQGHTPLGQVVRENVVGDDDDSTFNTGEKIGQMLNNAGESLTLGLVGDEMAGQADALIGRGNAEERTQFYRDNQAQFRDQHPELSLASEVAPAFLPGVGAVRAVQGATKMGRAAYGALVGAGSGATIGFMEGEGGFQNRTKNAFVTGALGGVFGAAAPKMLDALASAPRRIQATFQRSSQRPTVAALRATKNAAYDAVDQAGVTFSPEQMSGLSTRVQEIFANSNFDEVADTASGATLRILRGKEGREQTLGQLDRVRQNLWKRYATAGDQPQILDAIQEIDGLINNHPDASGLMDIARSANATFAKSQLLEDAFDRATRQTSVSGSGGNIANNYTRAVNSILNNKRQMRFFNADEEQAMRAFVQMADEGGPRLRRLIGKMSPNGNGLMMTLHAVGGMASGGATLPLMVAGGAAKSSADRAILRGGQALQDTLAGVRPTATPTNALSASSGGFVSAAAPLLEREQSNLRQAGSQARLRTR